MAGALVGLQFVDNLTPFTSIKSTCRRLGRNHGIGSSLIRQLMGEARAAKVPLTLSTAKINLASQLYERLGFRVVSEGEYKFYYVF